MRNSERLVGLATSEIPTPALLLDLDKLDFNLRAMSESLKAGTCALRPHIKAHKCPTIAALQVEHGAIGICCAKTGEAEVMATAGIRDILVANEVVDANKIGVLAGLARYCDIMVLVDTKENADQISSIARKFGSKVGLLIDVDVRLNRCGVREPRIALDLAKHIVGLDNVYLAGISAYEGGHGLDQQTVAACMAKGIRTKEMIEGAGIPITIVSAGSTGTWKWTSAYPGVTEIQAGSYALMELAYAEENLPFQIAISVLTTVISRFQQRVVLDAGQKAISQELGKPRVKDENSTTVTLHEEHGLLDLTTDTARLSVGDRLELLPYHCPTTTNLYDNYVCTRNDRVEAVWPIPARGRTD